MRLAIDERYREAVDGRFVGHDIVFVRTETTAADVLIDQIRDCEILLSGRSGPYVLSREMIEQLPNLQLLVKGGSGADHFDVEALSDHGILLTLNVGMNASSVADHILMLTLLCLRNAARDIINMRMGIWDRVDPPRPPYELAGKTVGIIGLGHIGLHVAKRVAGFGAHSISYQRTSRPDGMILAGIRSVSLDTLLRESDIVVLCVPHTRDTDRMIGERELSLMKPTAILINAARGRVIDESALYRALAERRILAAGLDTFEVEPTPPDNPLLALDNVVATPHVAGGSFESEQYKTPLTLDNIDRFLAGERPHRLANPDVWDSGRARARQARAHSSSSR
ncbi:MAG: 2-hydroxyacid dehydrogenase [Chloroflexi bacterium]|nr:2-hydroxyacid dehydrogenase [Chloroflexota bacterium]